jgi:hypothetical protein
LLGFFTLIFGLLGLLGYIEAALLAVVTWGLPQVRQRAAVLFPSRIKIGQVQYASLRGLLR